MTNLMTNKFCHPRVIHDKFGILGDKSCLSLKIICGVVIAAMTFPLKQTNQISTRTNLLCVSPTMTIQICYVCVIIEYWVGCITCRKRGVNSRANILHSIVWMVMVCAQI
jgi:hypothetical protein